MHVSVSCGGRVSLKGDHFVAAFSLNVNVNEFFVLCLSRRSEPDRKHLEQVNYTFFIQWH